MFCIAGVAVGVVAIMLGKPESLLYGADDNGNTCGSDNACHFCWVSGALLGVLD